MVVYVILFTLMILNGIILGKQRKVFVFTSFILLFLVAALRKYTVGIDLAGHYADNYQKLGKMGWDEIIFLSLNNNTYYDSGFIVFMRLLAIISDHHQWFIIATSAITFILVGRYILIFSEDVVLETFVFVTTFTYFMYMNIIAQSLAIAIVMCGIEFLYKKNYIKYLFVIFLAACIHSSAIICLVFIPLIILKSSKRNIVRVGICSIIIILAVDNILSIITKYILPQYAFYFKNGSSNMLDNVRILHLLVYLMCFIVGMFSTYFFNSYKSHNYKCIIHEDKYRFRALDNNFLIYTTLLSIVFRFLVTEHYIFSRLGFYFYLFAYSFLTSTVSRMKHRSNRRIVKLGIYLFMSIFFILLFKSVKPSYGVLPYVFFWE